MTTAANGTSRNGYSTLSSSAQRAMVNIATRGTPFDAMSDRLFLDFQNGDVFSQGSFDTRRVRTMLERDGTSKSLEQVLSLPIRSAEATIQPAKGDNGEAAFCRDVLGDKLDDLIDQMTSAIAYKQSFHEKCWALNDGKLVIDEMAWRPPQTCDARWGKDGTPDGFRQRVSWALDSSAQNTNNPTPGYVRIPRERAFVYVHGRHREPLTGVSDLDVVWSSWETRQKVQFLWFQFLEQQSLPKMVAYGQGIDDATVNAEAIASAKASGVIPMSYPNEPGAKTFDVVESSGQGAGQFLEAIRYLESKATNSVLAGFTELATAANNGNGSYALSADQSDFFLQSRQAVANEIASSIRRDCLTPLAVYNFGADAAIPTVDIGPLSNREQERSLALLQALLVSPVVQAPRGFLEQLLLKTAQFVGVDSDVLHDELDKARGTPDAYVSVAEVRQSANTTDTTRHDTPGSPGSRGKPTPPGQMPLPGMPGGADPEQTQLSNAVALSHELTTRALAGEDPQDVIASWSKTRRSRGKASAPRGADRLALTRHVRTDAGVKRYHLPIGSPLGEGGGNPLADAIHDAKRAGKSRFVKRHDDGSVTVHDETPDGAHYRVSPGGSLLHVDDQGRTRPVPAAARPAIERSLSGDADTQARHDFPAPSADVEHDVIEHADYQGTPAEKKALRKYTGNGYRMINGLLRGHLETDMERDRARGMVADLENVFDQHPPLHRNITVLRGLTDSGWLPSRNLANEKIVNKGFVSTTFDPETADSFGIDAMLEVQVPAGFKALPVAGVFGEDEQQEHELVLPHGTIFSVVSDEKRDVNGTGVRWLTVSAEPPTAQTAKVP